ncbi:MAG: hypothetical protein JNM34_06885 [Chthonomonadaceae bacterium]|nr:hypothetical protein [Chthonomonadaceae bacterium]
MRGAIRLVITVGALGWGAPAWSQLVSIPALLDAKWMHLVNLQYGVKLRIWRYLSEMAPVAMTKEHREAVVEKNVQLDIANGAPLSMKSSLKKSWEDVYADLARRSYRKGLMLAAWNGSVCAIKRQQLQMRHDGSDWIKQESVNYGVSDFKASFEYLSPDRMGRVEGSAEPGTSKAFDLVLGNVFYAAALANVPVQRVLDKSELKAYDQRRGTLFFETTSIIGDRKYLSFVIEVDEVSGQVLSVKHYAGTNTQLVGELVFFRNIKGAYDRAEWRNLNRDRTTRDSIKYELASTSPKLGEMQEICDRLGPKGAKVLDHRLGTGRRVDYELSDKIPDEKDIESLAAAQEEAWRLSYKSPAVNPFIVCAGLAATIGGIVILVRARRTPR